MKKSILLCAAVAVWTVSFAAAAFAAADNDTLAAVKAGRVVRMSVTGKNVNLRNQPSMKGKVVAQASPSNEGEHWDIFYFDAAPIEDKQDGSVWYKILFIPAWSAGRRGIITQIDKIPESGFSYLYVNSKFLKENQTDENSKAELEYELEYFKQGRPPLLKVGDGISEIKKHNRHNSVTGQYRITPTLKPITLCAEPVKGAKTFELPKGSNIVDYREAVHFADRDMFEANFLAEYIDMEEKEWIPVVDGKALQVIGWAEPDALDEVLPAPFDWSKLDWSELEGGDIVGEIMDKEYPLFIKEPKPES